MTAEEVLRENENRALGNNQIVSHITGKSTNTKKLKKAKSFGATGLITAMIIVFAILFSSGNLIPAAISERLVEETDVQYADAVESKKLVFQQAMYDGELPENTVAILEEHNVEVEKAENGEIVLKMNNKQITADQFIDTVSSDVNLYNAFNDATYSRAAYYYDESAKKVFKKIGTTRNNYSSDSDFDGVMDSLVKSGSKIEVENVTAAKSEDGESYEYNSVGTTKSSSGATEFINGVSAQNSAATTTEATLNSADSLKVADTISKEQRSKSFFLAFMENISKMKAGEGSESKINDAMNYLYAEHETEVVDVNTGEVVTVKGTAMDSPSLYAVLSGTEINTKAVENYSSDRVLKTVKNKLGTSSGVSGTVASTDTEVRGSIGRLLNIGESNASEETLNSVTKTIDGSLVNNSYETINGVNAGEFLVEGAVNVGKELAKASGATAGDAAAAVSYARLNSEILAMDAAADRLNRSPLDITSKNTFLGSIVYKMAVASAKNIGKNSGFFGMIFSSIKTFSNMTSGAVVSLMPTSYADETAGYLTSFGDCETYGTIGAVGSPQCAEVATFDTSTLNNTFNDAGFKAFVEANTTLNSSGTRTINRNSDLANFILYNNKRTTPLGVIDGGILESLSSGSSSVGFMSDILKMIQTFLGTSESEQRIASGATYVNSTANSDWQTYKYAQRYVSLARATESLRQYAGDETSYTSIEFFEGVQNPVIAFLEDYYYVAQR
jgi:uncharacterized protein YaiE (UPF0345 family)